MVISLRALSKKVCFVRATGRVEGDVVLIRVSGV